MALRVKLSNGSKSPSLPQCEKNSTSSRGIICLWRFAMVTSCSCPNQATTASIYAACIAKSGKVSSRKNMCSGSARLGRNSGHSPSP